MARRSLLAVAEVAAAEVPDLSGSPPTFPANRAVRGSYMVRLQEPDGELVTFVRKDYDRTRGFPESSAGEDFSALELFGGPVVAQLVTIDGSNESIADRAVWTRCRLSAGVSTA